MPRKILNAADKAWVTRRRNAKKASPTARKAIARKASAAARKAWVTRRLNATV